MFPFLPLNFVGVLVPTEDNEVRYGHRRPTPTIQVGPEVPGFRFHGVGVRVEEESGSGSA